MNVRVMNRKQPCGITHLHTDGRTVVCVQDEGHDYQHTSAGKGPVVVWENVAQQAS